MAKTETPITQSDVITGTGREYTLSKPTRKAGQLLGFSIDRTGWTDATAVLTAAMKISLDNGKTWKDWCSFTTKGGTDLGPTGQPLASSWACTPPPDIAIIKAVVTSNGKSVQQAVSLLEVS